MVPLKETNIIGHKGKIIIGMIYIYDMIYDMI